MKLRYVKKQHEMGEVWSYYFEPHNMPEWQAGQYVNLTMPDVAPVFSDRIFTIASAPHEPLLQFTTILTPSPFKQKLNLLNPGDEIEVDQLGGDFTWDAIPSTLSDDGAVRRLFIAGGIGITPYLSIIRDKLHKNEPINATLLYAGKHEKCPFINELHQATKTDPTLKLNEYSDVKLTLRQLKIDISDIKNYIIYLAGSQKFSEDLGEGLLAEGFPRQQIKYDYFDGYTNMEY